MKLFYSVNSPYARKARIVTLEKGLESMVAFTVADPMQNPPELIAVNPLGKIPALVLDNGETLCESPVICEYLDSLAPAPALFPASGTARWKALNLAAIADGIMDAAVVTVMEGRRPAEKQWDMTVERYKAAIMRAVHLMEKETLALKDTLNIGTIAAAVALGYISFRRPELNWRKRHARLAEWFDGFSTRTSMQATMPQA